MRGVAFIAGQKSNPIHLANRGKGHFLGHKCSDGVVRRLLQDVALAIGAVAKAATDAYEAILAPIAAPGVLDEVVVAAPGSRSIADEEGGESRVSGTRRRQDARLVCRSGATRWGVVVAVEVG